jgi:hypothetical protein
MLDMHKITGAVMRALPREKHEIGAGHDSLEETIAYACSIGRAEQFFQQFRYLAGMAAGYGRYNKEMERDPVPVKTDVVCELYPDFAPYSFCWAIKRKDEDGKWVLIINGGFIYHSGYKGEVKLQDGEWSIHT